MAFRNVKKKKKRHAWLRGDKKEEVSEVRIFFHSDGGT